MTDGPPPAPQEPKGRRKPRRGTETRQRQRRLTYRITEGEYAQVVAAASAAGLTLASYARQRTVSAPTTPARRMPSEERVILLSLKAELNRVGGHIYQHVRHMNFGGYPEAGEAHAAYNDYLMTSAAIRLAVERVGR